MAEPWTSRFRRRDTSEDGATNDLSTLLRQQEAVARLGQLALTELGEADLISLAVHLVADRSEADGAVVLECLADDTFVERGTAGCRADHGGMVRVSAPIGLNGSAYGMLAVHRHDGAPFARRDVHFVNSVANVLGSSISRRHAEAELRRTHALFSAVIEGTPDAVFVKDLEGRYLVINDAGASHTNRNRSELIGATAYDVFPTDEATEMTDADRQVVAAGSPRTFEEVRRQDGRTHVALVTKGPVFDDAGEVVGLFGIARDITDRKEHEEALERSEERLRLAQEGARMGTWEADLVTGKDTWSDGLCRVYGVEPGSEASLERFLGLVHPDDRERVQRTIDESLAREENYEIEYRLSGADGECRWVLSRSTLQRDEEDRVVRLLGVSTDVTEARRADEERSRLEHRLRQAERLEVVGQLAGGIAHDFNNLLLALRGYGEHALRRIAANEPEATEDVEEMLAAADRAASLTRQLLAFSRRQVLDPEILDLGEVVRDIDRLLRRMIGEDIELVPEAPVEPVLVEADRGQLEQVITNLAVNARDAMPGGGRLTIAVSTAELPGAPGDGLHALLTVTDSGCGMDPETAARIFEPFFTTKEETGTGLGLATVHGIVSQSGGHLGVRTSSGQGTTFEVYLPLAVGAAVEQIRPPAPAEAGSGERILLIEDDATVRSIVQLMLESSGYNVLPASGGEDALALLDEHETPVQLAVSDMVMRGLNGRETVERLRRRQPGLRVLYMSGYTDDTVVRGGGLRAGTGFIQKPFSGDELSRRVRELLDREAA